MTLRSIAACILVPALLLPGCTEAPAEARSDRYGGVFNINETEHFRSIFPLSVKQANAWRVAGQIYEGLVKVHPGDLHVMPALAESWEVDGSGREYTFSLREGVRFHDDPAFPGGRGRELEAADVVACFERICTPGMGDEMFWLFNDRVVGAEVYHRSLVAGGTGAGGVQGIKALDERTVRITLRQPSPLFLLVLTHPGCWIYPHELIDAHGSKLADHAIGTGPFRLHSVGADQAMVLRRWEHYWDKDEAGRTLPYLDAVRITFDQAKDREFQHFLHGHLTMVDELPADEPEALADSIDKASGRRLFRAWTMPSMSVQYYGFNVRKAPFDDVRVRRALALAIDRSKLVEVVLHGMAIPAGHGLVPPGMQGYPYDLVPGVPFDPDSAAWLLADAGYPGGRGFPPVVVQVNNDGFAYLRVAEAVQEMLERSLGIGITLSVLPSTQHYERVESGGALMWRGGWIADHPDPENFLALLDSRGISVNGGPAGLNTTGYSSARFDSLLQAGAARPNPAERLRSFALAEQQAMQDLPLLPLYHERSVRVAQPYVEGLSLNPIEWLDLSRVWFNKALRDPA